MKIWIGMKDSPYSEAITFSTRKSSILVAESWNEWRMVEFGLLSIVWDRQHCSGLQKGDTLQNKTYLLVGREEECLVAVFSRLFWAEHKLCIDITGA